MASGQGVSFQTVGLNSKTFSVSGNGQVFVGITPDDKAGYWQDGIGWQDFGFGGYAYDANYDGSVIVGFTGSSSSQIGGNDAYRWSSAGGMTYLPDPANLGLAVSRNGTTVVGVHGGGSSDRHPFVYDPVSGTIDLSGISGVPSVSYARAVSHDGAIIGGDGFLWTRGQATAQSMNMSVRGMSNYGDVVVGYRGVSNGSALVRWTAATGEVELPQLAYEGTSGNYHYALGCTSDGGLIAGYHAPYSGYNRALIWDEADGIRYLQDDLEGIYGMDLGDWRLETAYVSDNGLVFTGRAKDIYTGQQEAYVVALPEPATLGLLAAGGLALLQRKRRKRS